MFKMLHIISHTDLDGVAAAALAWHVNGAAGRVMRVSLSGYGEVDENIMNSLRAGDDLLVLDLFCQREQTIDEIDRQFDESQPPFLFDHHKSTYERYAGRKWACVDLSCCGASVYKKWLEQSGPDERTARVIKRLSPIVEIANDRDLWLGQIPESRLWQGLITLCGPWSVFARLAADPSAEMSPSEEAAAKDFVERQEARFAAAKEKVVRTGNDLSYIYDGLLEYGDVSDFCGMILDREPDPPLVAAVGAKRFGGDWAVSMRSRNGFAGRVMTLLKDGRRVRGGGHGDAAALYFPRSYNEEQIRESIVAAIKAERERNQSPNVTLGDLFKGLSI
jgi:hypothetical protein